MSKSADFQTVLARRLSRRGLLQGATALGASALLPGCSESTTATSVTETLASSSLTFPEVAQGLDAFFTVAEGYQHHVLVSWGDALFDGVPEFEPKTQTAALQQQRFGYNNDFIGFVPLPLGSDNSDKGLLVVNHEYTNSQLMWPGSPSKLELDEAQTEVDIAAHGLSVVEIEKVDNAWQLRKDSSYNRRITPLTEMQMSGPAAGNERLKTAISKDGVRTLGTYGNCAGGVTPWGTILTGEENVDFFFAGDYTASAAEESHQRFGMHTLPRSSWPLHFERWDLSKNPNEGLHVGWIVEIDPYDPTSTPKKRTALGRCKHEGCNVYIGKDGKVVAYTGDDQRFEYLYKFVSSKTYDANNRSANMDILDHGTLYCARFYDDGKLQWLPLVQGQGPLVAENGFHSQADVTIDVRKAADLLGATPMDRPEDVEVNPGNGKVYVMLTNNTERTEEQTDAANPRANNKAGQIVELIAPNDDHSQTEFRWEMLLLAGEKSDPSSNYHPATTENGWLACPDNCAFDNLGNLWIATDGAQKFGIADGVWATEVEGDNRALTKRFLRAPVGAELCGPFFTPNAESFFCSVQHPGERSRYEEPSTRWPDFRDDMPPRPSVVVINKKGGGRIGS